MEDNFFCCSQTNEKEWKRVSGEVRQRREGGTCIDFCELSSLANLKKRYGVGRKAMYIARKHGVHWSASNVRLSK